MKIIAILASAVIFAAAAAIDATVTYEGSQTTYNLRVDAKIISRHASLEEAIAAAKARGAGTYTVTQPTATVVAVVVPDQPPPPPPAPAPAGALYLSSTGSDGSNCSQAAPCRSFARAWAALKPGMVLIVGDGTYTAVSPPTGFSGTAEAPITVRAANPGAARLSTLSFRGSAYLTFSGFRITGADRAVDIASAGAGKASHHLTFREIGFDCTPGTLNDGACFQLYDGTNNVTLEDSWGWGGGRYTVLCYGGPGGSPPNTTCDNNRFRRLVLRQGPTRSSSGNPQASISLYYASGNTVESVIAIDGNASSDTSNATFYVTAHGAPPSSSANKLLGVIALKNKGYGFFVDCTRSGAICNATEVRDSTFWANAGGIAMGGSSSANCANNVLQNVRLGHDGTKPVDIYQCAVTNTGGSVTGTAGAAIVAPTWLPAFEARIRAEMCAAVTTGWCSGSKSLTDYVRSGGAP